MNRAPGSKPWARLEHDKEGLCAQDSSLGWLLQMLNDGISLGLILRLWDVYLLEREQVLMPMTSIAFKVQRKRLMKTSRSGLWARFRNQFFHTWELDDDSVLKYLRASTKKLTRKQGDLPPPGIQNCQEGGGRSPILSWVLCMDMYKLSCLEEEQLLLVVTSKFRNGDCSGNGEMGGLSSTDSNQDSSLTARDEQQHTPTSEPCLCHLYLENSYFPPGF
ncbi:PREDICTED: TBC1 domain family member 3B-like [Mandrillus leucophaeus]|uniref:TBC1 domain family member 3B-like n=1 Tax=Mandrillus leucophaeus TaxID=9568 RepID=UPI0005F3C79B|nr:PREDICTED: TBC1 domain family member 3B-like [Mandrillus leucophaeus]